MARCSFYDLGNGVECGASVDNVENLDCLPVLDCWRNIKGHLSTIKVNDSTLRTEVQLLFARAGIFDISSNQEKSIICPRHRDLLGTRWRSKKRYCSTPVGWCGHRVNQCKGDRGITLIQSKDLYLLTKCLLPIGSPICKRCRNQLKDDVELNHLNDSDSNKQSREACCNPAPAKAFSESKEESTCTSLTHDTSKASLEIEPDESLADTFAKLTVADDKTFALSDTENSSQDSCAEISSTDVRLENLNTFLRSCEKEEVPVGHPRKAWDSLTSKSRRSYVARATNAIVSSLQVIASSDADKLWGAVQSSKSVDHALGCSQPSEAKYLKALTETYQNANS